MEHVAPLRRGHPKIFPHLLHLQPEKLIRKSKEQKFRENRKIIHFYRLRKPTKDLFQNKCQILYGCFQNMSLLKNFLAFIAKRRN